MKKQAGGGSEKILWSILGVSLLLVAIYVVSVVRDRPAASTTAAASASKDYEKLRKDAARNRPNQPINEAVKEEAAKQMEAGRAAQGGDPQKLAEVAADQFWGAFLVNTRTRVTYCRELGVDVSAFASAWQGLHKREIERATAIYAKKGASVEKLYSELEGPIRRAVDDATRAAAKESNSTPKDVCQDFAARGPEIADGMQISKVQPAIQQALFAQ